MFFGCTKTAKTIHGDGNRNHSDTPIHTPTHPLTHPHTNPHTPTPTHIQKAVCLGSKFIIKTKTSI